MKKQSTNPKQESVEKLVHDFQTTGSRVLQSKIVEKYENVIKSIARKYSKGTMFHEDIEQVGRVGLLSAIRRFDSSVGKSFYSFAIPTIIGEIKHFLRDKTWSLHVPRRVKEMGTKVRKAEDELTISLQRKPDVHEIASYLEVDSKDLLKVMELGQAYNTMSVDAELIKDGKTATILDIVGKKDNGFETALRKMVIKNALHVLTAREKLILHYTFIKEKSQKETGRLVGVSQMHVSRIQRNALKKLQQAVLG
ncbi:RNA polymerase sigma factor SigB [Ferdinandcohnia sp. Marseille-Q9671]